MLAGESQALQDEDAANLVKKLSAVSFRASAARPLKADG
jgi:hypothetical protein